METSLSSSKEKNVLKIVFSQQRYSVAEDYFALEVTQPLQNELPSYMCTCLPMEYL